MSLFANAKSALLSDSSTTNSTSEIAQQSNIFSNNTGATGLFSNQAQTQPTSVFANNQPGTFGGGTGMSRPTASPAQQQGMFGQFQPASSVFTSNSHVTSAFPPQTTTASGSTGGGLFGNQSGGGGGGGLFGSQSQSTSEGSGLFGGGGGLISAQAASASLLSGGGNSGGLLGSQGTGGLLSGGGGGLLGSQGNGGGLLSGQPSASLLSGGGGLLGSQIVGGLSGAQIGGGLLGAQPGGGLLGAQTGGGLLGAQSTGGLLGAQPMGMGSNVFGGGLTAQQPSASTSQANSNGPSSTNPPGIGTFDHIGRVHVYRDPARDWAVASITGAIPNQGLEELRVRDYLALKRGQVNPDRVREVEQIREQNRRARDSGFIPPPANSIPPNQNVTPPSSNNNGSQFGAQIQAQTTSGGSSLLGGGGGGFGGPQAGGFGGGARATGFGSGTQAGGMGGGLPVLSPGANPLNNMSQMVPNTTGRIIPSTGLATVAQAQPTFGQGGNQIPGGMRQQAGQLIQGGPAGAFGQQQMISGAGASMGALATRPTFGAGPLGGAPTGTSFGAQLQQYPQPAIQKFPGTPGMNQSSFIQQATQFGGVIAPAEKEKRARGRPKKAQPATQNVNTTSSQFYYEINKMLFVSGFVDLLSKHNFSAPEGLLDDTDFTAKFVEFLEGYDISLPKEGIPKFQVEVAKQTSEEATEVVRRKPRKIVVEDSDSEEEKIDLAEKPKAKKAPAGKKATAPKKEEIKPKGKKAPQAQEESSEESEEEEKPVRKPKRLVSASRSRSPVRQESEQVSRSKSPRRRSTSRDQQKKRRKSVEKRQVSRSRSKSEKRKRSTSRRKSTGARRSSGTLTNQALHGLDGLATEKAEETQEEAGITTTF